MKAGDRPSGSDDDKDVDCLRQFGTQVAGARLDAATGRGAESIDNLADVPGQAEVNQVVSDGRLGDLELRDELRQGGAMVPAVAEEFVLRSAP
jgi:hypothetical protein